MPDTPNKEQVKRFRAAARELGADGSEEQFDTALRRLATVFKSKSAKPKKPKPRR